MVGFTGNQPPSLVRSENYHISIIKCIFVTFIILENPRVLEPVPETEMETNYIYIYVHINIYIQNIYTHI